MADSKISALTASTTPLTGTEVLPVVQSGTTKKVSVANLTAGRAVSAASMELTAGNYSAPAGNGLDFSAQPGIGDSKILTDYREGTFTATAAPQTSGTIDIWVGGNTLAYTKIGRLVTITGMLVVGSVSSPVGDQVIFSSLPFTVANLAQYSGHAACNGSIWQNASGAYASTSEIISVVEGGTTFALLMSAALVETNDQFIFSFSYFAA